jgi:heavy metal sensor kinase
VIKSLRWKLLAWYAVILAALSAVFGALLYANVRRSLARDVDTQLEAQASALAGVTLPAELDKFFVELTPEQVEFFSGEGDGAFHYGIWDASGQLIDSSHPSLEIAPPQLVGSRERGPYREAAIRGPADSWILVGKDVRRERQQLQGLAATAVGAGVAALVLMLFGGWILTGRALAPIQRISRAATAVSASNLSERIDVSRMETELADLAGTINGAFDRLQAAFEQQTRFTADASHELRTPLAIVLSHAELSLKHDRTDAEYREALSTIHRAARRMKGVVEDLLTLARADAGRIEVEESRFDLAQLVEETCQMFAPLAEEKQIHLDRNLAPLSVVGDRNRLGEAVSNLLVNAIHYNYSGGRVDVTLSANGPDAELRIANTGPAIPAEDRPHIFERFYRVDKARSREVDGSGLGLAITKWIVDAHGGSIACENGEGEGAMFVIRLKSAP